MTQDALDEIVRTIESARRLERTLNAALAEDALKADQWRVLHALAHSPGALMGELAERLVIPAASLTRMVDELADRGLLFRRPAPDDRRKAGVYLSRLGHEQLARASSIISARVPPA
ncbi:MAG: MarR family transcriptional regulator [Microbacterium sp.]